MFKKSLLCLCIGTSITSLSLVQGAESNSPSEPQKNNNSAKSEEANQTIHIEVVADSVSVNETLGKSVINKSQIQNYSVGSNTINDIAYTAANVQFLDNYNTLSGDSIIDNRPSKISISGGHYYDNNFVVDGMRTNTLHDSTNDKMRSATELVGHPQTIFVNPAMVESVTIYDSNVPASYGHFTGGVFEVKTKDPSGEFHTGFTFGYESDDTMKYILVAPEDYDEEDVPEKPRYTEYQFSAYVDTPVTEKTSALFEYSKQISDLKNRQSQTIYKTGASRTHSYTENYKVKAKTELNDFSSLKFTSIYTPSEMTDVEQSLRTQKNKGWQNTVEYFRETDNSTLEVTTGYQHSDMGREQPANNYRYSRTASITWGGYSSYAMTGGWGDIDAEEVQIPLKINYTLNINDTAKLNAGLEYAYEYASSTRKEDSYGYTLYHVSDLIVSADGEDDPTVIDGEQAFKQRSHYSAYDVDASINNIGLWLEFSNKHHIGSTKLSYRLGTRYDREDFLDNGNLAPRLVVTFTPKEWLDVTVGWNRYYAGNFLAYKLRELQPSYTLETRTYTEIDGKYVYSSEDWKLKSVSRATRYSQADVDTPYNDEITLATTFHTGLGDLKLQYLDRKGRDEFARSASETVTEDGVTQKYYFITNNGFTDYESFSFEWSKNWKNNDFNINATFSETKTSKNSNYIKEYTDEDALEEVYYNDQIITFSDLEQIREGFGSPDYVNMAWSSYWLKNRLSLTLVGRLEFAYDSIRQNGRIRVDGTRYAFYEDYRVSDRYTLNLNTEWVVYEDANFGTVKLYAKVRNIFNSKNESGDIDDDLYYEKGRSLWLGFSYDF